MDFWVFFHGDGTSTTTVFFHQLFRDPNKIRFKLKLVAFELFLFLSIRLYIGLYGSFITCPFGRASEKNTFFLTPKAHSFEYPPGDECARKQQTADMIFFCFFPDKNKGVFFSFLGKKCVLLIAFCKKNKFSEEKSIIIDHTSPLALLVGNGFSSSQVLSFRGSTLLRFSFALAPK